jgi:hypothetical protein
MPEYSLVDCNAVIAGGVVSNCSDGGKHICRRRVPVVVEKARRRDRRRRRWRTWRRRWRRRIKSPRPPRPPRPPSSFERAPPRASHDPVDD